MIPIRPDKRPIRGGSEMNTMPRLILSLLLLLIGQPLASQPAPPGLSGHWVGEIEREGHRAPITIDLEMSGSEVRGQVDVPSMGIFRAPILDPSLNEHGQPGSVRLTVPLVTGGLTLRGTPTARVFEGRLSQNGLSQNGWGLVGTGTFRLTKVARPAPRFVSEPISFT